MDTRTDKPRRTPLPKKERPKPIRLTDAAAARIGEVTVNMTFDPPWTPDRMSEEAKLELNMF